MLHFLLTDRLPPVVFRMRVAGFALILLLLGGCSGMETRPGTDTAPAGDETAATRNFSTAVLYKLLTAEIARKRNRLDLAVSLYLEAAKESQDPSVAERAARIAVFARDQQSSLAAAILWIRLAPHNLAARQVHAALLIRANRTTEAAHALSALIDEANDSPRNGFKLVTTILSRQKDKKRAFKIMEELVKKRPDDVRAIYILAQLAVQVGNLAQAKTLLQRVLELEPGHPQAPLFLARILQSEGDTGTALVLLSDALKKNPSKTTRFTYARMLVDAKRYEAARKEFEWLVKEMPDNADAHFALGLLLLQTGRLEAARVPFGRLIEMGQRLHIAHYYLGQIEESGKHVEAAIKTYRKVSGGEHFLNAQIRIGVLLANRGKIDEARQHLHGLERKTPPQAVRIQRVEAEILTRAGQLETALTVYDAALLERPGNDELLYARAMLAVRLDRIDIVERDLRDILSRNPDNADALNALGFSLADQTQRYQEAMELIQQALALKPDDHYVIDSMGWLLYRLGRYPEAVQYLRRAFAVKNDPEIAAHLGEVLWAMGNKDDAKAVWKSALDKAPADQRLIDLIKRFTQ